MEEIVKRRSQSQWDDLRAPKKRKRRRKVIMSMMTKTKPMMTKHSHYHHSPNHHPTHVACCWLLLVAISLSPLVFILQNANLVSSQAAVVRPTIFSDLNQSPSSAAAAAAAAAAANGVVSSNSATIDQGAATSTQQQDQQISPSAAAASAASSSSSSLSLQQQQQQQSSAQQATQVTQQINNPHTQISQQNTNSPSDGTNQSPSTKITPLKSRFCTNANTGARSDSPLGLQSLAIDDFALSASSFSHEHVRPHLARLNLDISGGAWCPMKPISQSNFGKEWIQVKLNRSHVISAIETQGRFGMGSGKEFVPQYQVEYSRDSGRHWYKWKDFRGYSYLKGNDDPNSPIKNELSPPIVGANVIRILPFSQQWRTVCLRFELHGCPYDEGAPIAYSSADGVVEPRWGHLIDYTYDGLRRSGQLSGGLGQLVDGVKGADNFSHNNGFEWVGWKMPTSSSSLLAPSSGGGELVIEFSFRSVRNFSSAHFHSNNLFSQGVEVFQAVDVHYGIDVNLSQESVRDSLNEQQLRQDGAGPFARSSSSKISSLKQQAPASSEQHTLWSPDVLSIEYEPDKALETSRPVTVHLKHRLANKLRFVLKFSSKWILVSEVEFHSQPVELLSPLLFPPGGATSASNQHEHQQTLALLQALTPAKSYDEYIAILREHQLRRIAALAYLESFGGVGVGSPTSSSSSPYSLIGRGAGSSTFDSIGSDYSSTASDSTGFDSSSSATPTAAYESADYPASAGRIFQQQQQQGWMQQHAGSQAPPPANDFVGQQQQPPAPASIPNYMNPLMVDSENNILLTNKVGRAPPPSGSASGGNNNNNNISEQVAAGGATSGFIGMATVISFVLVSIILFLGALFALSSYRLRKQPKLGTPTSVGLGVSLGGGGPLFATAGTINNHNQSTILSPSSHHHATLYQQHQQHLYHHPHHHTLHHTTTTPHGHLIGKSSFSASVARSSGGRLKSTIRSLFAHLPFAASTRLRGGHGEPESSLRVNVAGGGTSSGSSSQHSSGASDYVSSSGGGSAIFASANDQLMQRNHNTSSQPAHHLAAAAAAAQHYGTSTGHQQQASADAAAAMRAASTLKRLASLTQAQKSSHHHQHHQQHQQQHPLLAQHQQRHLPAATTTMNHHHHQLLVSLKDSSAHSSPGASNHSHTLFGGGGGASNAGPQIKSQAVSSQLIVGLNPMNASVNASAATPTLSQQQQQQQIYNNSNQYTCPQSNQTYTYIIN